MCAVSNGVSVETELGKWALWEMSTATCPARRSRASAGAKRFRPGPGSWGSPAPSRRCGCCSRRNRPQVSGSELLGPTFLLHFRIYQPWRDFSGRASSLRLHPKPETSTPPGRSPTTTTTTSNNNKDELGRESAMDNSGTNSSLESVQVEEPIHCTLRGQKYWDTVLSV